MNKAVTWRALVRELLESHASPSMHADVEAELVTDDTHGHYLVIYVGWRGNQRVRECTLHVDVKGDKIWIQHDGTERGLASELIERGVPKEDIVLGFRAPSRRRDTEFATS